MEFIEHNHNIVFNKHLFTLIPDFNTNGNLPPGIHFVTFDEFIVRFGYNSQRNYLLSGFRELIKNLKSAGCSRVFVDGSFTTNKELPNDYDMCWDATGVDPYKLESSLLDFSTNGRIVQKGKFFGDIFPAQLTEKSRGIAFINFFQVDKLTGDSKGIIAINL